MTRLRRSSPDSAGWGRRRAGTGFVYVDERGKRLPKADADRVKALVIPARSVDSSVNLQKPSRPNL